MRRVPHHRGLLLCVVQCSDSVMETDPSDARQFSVKLPPSGGQGHHAALKLRSFRNIQMMTGEFSVNESDLLVLQYKLRLNDFRRSRLKL